MPTQINVFISSKMQELKAERQVVYDLLSEIKIADIRLQAWVFEQDAPASDKSIRDVYLEALSDSALYVALLWNEYGEWTIDEFKRATELGIERHVYVKAPDPAKQDARLRDFIAQESPVETGVTMKWFTGLEDLRRKVEGSLRSWVQKRLLSHPGSAPPKLDRFRQRLRIGRSARFKFTSCSNSIGGR